MTCRGLALVLPCCCTGARVDQLATELQALRGAGHEAPYVYVDMRKHVPSWAATDSQADVDGEFLVLWCSRLHTQPCTGSEGQPLSREIAKELARSMNPGASASKRAPLTWNQWQLAYPRFAIEAAACGMIPFAASMGHMVGCMCMLMCGLLCAVGSGELPAHCRDCLCRRKSPAMAGDPLR